MRTRSKAAAPGGSPSKKDAQKTKAPDEVWARYHTLLYIITCLLFWPFIFLATRSDCLPLISCLSRLSLTWTIFFPGGPRCGW